MGGADAFRSAPASTGLSSYPNLLVCRQERKQRRGIRESGWWPWRVSTARTSSSAGKARRTTSRQLDSGKAGGRGCKRRWCGTVTGRTADYDLPSAPPAAQPTHPPCALVPPSSPQPPTRPTPTAHPPTHLPCALLPPSLLPLRPPSACHYRPAFRDGWVEGWWYWCANRWSGAATEAVRCWPSQRQSWLPARC